MKKLVIIFIFIYSFSFAKNDYDCYEIDTYGRYAESTEIEIYDNQNFIINVKENIIEWKDIKYLEEEREFILNFHIITNNDFMLNGAYADNNMINFGFISLNKKNKLISKVIIDENYGETIQYGICNEGSNSAQF